jgi:hypothetical protein
MRNEQRAIPKYIPDGTTMRATTPTTVLPVDHEQVGEGPQFVGQHDVHYNWIESSIRLISNQTSQTIS